jgi:hypothetical protein
LQVFFSGHNPVFKRGLSPLMKWMYGSVLLSYFSAFMATPLLMVVPIVTVSAPAREAAPGGQACIQRKACLVAAAVEFGSPAYLPSLPAGILSAQLCSFLSRGRPLRCALQVWFGAFPIVINLWAAIAITVYYTASTILMYYTRSLGHLKVLQPH